MSFPNIDSDQIVPTPVTNGVMNYILETIRAMESGGNYGAQNRTASASGAYQFIDSTWKNLASAMSTATPYANGHAKDAPPAIQDAVAAFHVRTLLINYDYHLAAVPLGWYYEASINNPGKLDAVPSGNKLTPRQYAVSWLGRYNSIVSTGTGVNTGAHVNTPWESATNGIPGVDAATGAVKSIGGAISSVPDFLSMITNPTWVIRALKVVGGMTIIGVGIVLVGGSNDTVRGAVTQAAKTSAA